ncbi:unnamed protein product [Cylindrotheca closterium]|uniref:Uncharacterized protein n=1 Tax=Cylindrotheca closterium TaxID=2856 RepID=A0AAD2CKV8_9STRA|nr:unnamed protein product [Cylindrotheca closterium]
MTNYAYLEDNLSAGHAFEKPSTSILDKSSRTGSSESSTRQSDQSLSEAAPLMNYQSYDTFGHPQPALLKGPLDDDEPAKPRMIRIISPERPSFIHRLCCCVIDRDRTEERLKEVDLVAWTTVLVISVIIAIVAYFFHVNTTDSTSPSWHFDYNVYISRTGSFQRSSRVALIAQVASSRQLENFSLISSRPNRAYARFWGQDYVRYNAGRGHVYQRSCFDKVHVLNEVLDQQLMDDDDETTIHRWSRRPYEVKYDSLVIIPPDSIIMDLDTDIIESILPSDKLVAIAGWDDNPMIDSHSGIVVFNLNHKYASAVAKLWREFILPIHETCGANNDLEILITAIYSVMDSSTEDIEDLIQSVKETRNGYTADQLIKSLEPSVPGYRAKYLEKTWMESIGTLQQTVASVCYRFYPKCEVL